MLALALIILLFLYMRWEYQNIKVTYLPLNHEGIKIVYAADFQYDMKSGRPESLREKTFQKAIDMIMEQGADVILLGGDYTTYSSNWEAAVPFLQQLDAPMGVFAVFGNHDSRVRSKLVQALPNIRFLENESAEIATESGTIVIYGAADLWTGTLQMPPDEVPEGSCNILLTHNPDYFERLIRYGESPFDLTLAGHLHAGQATVFGIVGIPFVLDTVTDYGEKYRYGEKKYDGNRIYITSGLGGSVFGQPLRFGARPEIVVIF